MLPKYVKRVRAKGREYLYFDTGKTVDGKKVYTRLPALRSPDFGGSYAALMGHRNRKGPAEQLSIPKLIDLYQRSPAYRSLAAASKKLYDIYLTRLERLLPTAPAAEVSRGDMRRLVDKMADTPGAANAFLSASRTLFSWGEGHEYITKNPCDGIDSLPMGEHQPWPDHVLRATLEASDARVRLVANLLYYTAQRIGDVLAMSWADIIANRVSVVQEKTKTKLTIGLHTALRDELARQPRRGLLICVDDAGKPLKQGTISKALSDHSAKQGVRCVPHGLRKNAVIALLEAGCSVAETSAVSGQSLQMVELYAKGRNQTALADAAILRWEANDSRTYKTQENRS